MTDMTCIFCGMDTSVREHHLIPRCQDGTETVPTCEVCESFIHKKWDHRQLRDTYNNVETILADEGFQKFLKWRLKQPPTVLFKSSPGKFRTRHPYH